MKALILSILALTACGTQSSEQAGTTMKVDAAQSTTNESAPSKTAMLVGSVKNMPICTADLEGQLIYVKDDKQFYFCSEKVWNKIDLTGKAGTDGKDAVAQDGKDGTNGVDGKDGINGTNGINGSNGSNGAAAPMADDRVWIHPVTGVKWFVGHSIMNIYYSGNVPNLLSDNFICPAGSHSPDDDEFYDASAAGIWYKFSTFSPLLVSLGSFGTSVPYTYGPDATVGTQGYYHLRVTTNGSYINDSYNGVSYVTAKALCVVGD